MRKLALAILVLGASAGLMVGCPAAHDEFPGLACKVDSDCFQGESCVGLVCTPPDMSIPGDMAFPKFDFARPDLTEADGDQMPDMTSGGDL